MPLRKHIRQRAQVGIEGSVTTREGWWSPTYYLFESAVPGSLQVINFTSKSGESSRWLVLFLKTYGQWIGVSRDFYFSQKFVQSAATLSGLKSNIQDFVDKKTTNFDQLMYKDANGEYWVLGQDEGIINDFSYAVTGAYDGICLYGGTDIKAAERVADLEKAVSMWVTKYAVGPVDPNKSLTGYNEGHYAVYEGPKTEKGELPKGPASQQEIEAAQKAIAGPGSADKKAPAKDASPWQIPAGPAASGEAGGGGAEESVFAPMPQKSNIPWTPIVLGGGALLAAAYFMRKG